LDYSTTQYFLRDFFKLLNTFRVVLILNDLSITPHGSQLTHGTSLYLYLLYLLYFLSKMYFFQNIFH